MRQQRSYEYQVELARRFAGEVRRKIEFLCSERRRAEMLLRLVFLADEYLRIGKELDEMTGNSAVPARQVQQVVETRLPRKQHGFADDLQGRLPCEQVVLNVPFEHVVLLRNRLV